MQEIKRKDRNTSQGEVGKFMTKFLPKT